MIKPWHPADEATAASTLAVFVEWLRATGRKADADPAAVRDWAARDALRQNAPPVPLDLGAGGWRELVASAAWHLLDENVRPDDRVVWGGAIGDAWALGALICGATLILTDAAGEALAEIAAAEKAKILRRPLSNPDAR